ncbi:hypothetical protein CAPTEDRAFT_213599 [Capitella teleta]|uniref:Uncharacterized protein n=1 Tax=Capitella teleta TaxID=283909 RepID=R7VC09_CAPTE|nr:hypothetical protein CAPTEDRAFT_213599 [Capitella teleta]|eukprot:ELU16383.1 hypothetical protein CAPTEDRAFT_213599 [Capitella teleta]
MRGILARNAATFIPRNQDVALLLVAVLLVTPLVPQKLKIRQQILDEDADAYTAVNITSELEKKGFPRLYCEMGLNGGGYTHPFQRYPMKACSKSLPTEACFFVVENRQQADSVRPRTDAWLRVIYCYPYVIMMCNNMLLHRGHDLMRPCAATEPFRVSTWTANRSMYTNCDVNGNSQIILFPNFAEFETVNTTNTNFSICTKLFTLGTQNPSDRLMHRDDFMSAELHFGGCDCPGTPGSTEDTVLALNIGFR